MIIPSGYMHAQYIFQGDPIPEGAVVTAGHVNPGGGDFGETLVALFETHVMPRIHNQIQLEGIRLKFGPNSTGPYVEIPSGQAGSISGSAAPPNTATLVRKRTALGGRANRGRLFLPGLIDSQIGDAGLLDGPTRTDTQAAMDAWLDALSAASTPMVILHNASSDPTIVTSLTVDVKVATQRRRLR